VADKLVVTKFRLSQDRASAQIREIAADSQRVVIPAEGDSAWEQTVSHLQVMRCLENGRVKGTPKLDEFGNWVCDVERFGAGVLVTVTVAIDMRPDRLNRLYVLGVTRD
jgi:hypothetical protein